MLRYLRLYGYFLRFSFSRAMEFRFDFFFRVVMDCGFYAIHLAFFWTLYRHTSLMGSWDRDQAIIFISGIFFVDALHMTLFSNNMWMLPFLVNRGDLDYYLVRPVSTLFFVALREFAANSFLNLIIAAGILTWAIGRYPGDLGAGPVLLYVVLLLFGTFLHWNIHMLFLIPVFWLHSVEGLRQLFFGFTQFSERPDQIFRGWLRRLLVTIIPFALIASYPAHILFEGGNGARTLHILIVAAGIFCVTCYAWGRGLRAYASASS